MTEAPDPDTLEKVSHPARALSEAVDAGKVHLSGLLNAIGINANDPVHQAALLACDKYGLDPLMKHVIVIPKSGPFVTRDGYLHVAHRSGQLDGIEIVEEGASTTHWEATAVVHRKDMRVPFRYKGRYPKAGQNKKYGQEMAVTRAERTALSRAFPIDGLSGGDDAPHQPNREATDTLREIEEMAAVRDWQAEHGEEEPADD